MKTRIGRREAIALIGAASAAALAACGGSPTEPEAATGGATTSVYASRGNNPTCNTRDGIFADSLQSELASVSGDPATSLSATFQVGIGA